MYNQASYLIHFGVLGQKWGVRRYQNEDGTLTDEGRRRYLDLSDRETVNRINNIAGKTTDIFNKKHIPAINKKYDERYGKDYDITKDSKANMEYTREMMDAWKSTYREVLAKDLGTDPKSLEGQKWLDEMFAYKTNLDDDYEKLSNKKNNSSKQESGNKKDVSVNSTVKNKSKPKNKNDIDMNPKPLKDYSNRKMKSLDAVNQAYDDLEKIYPNFFNLSQKQQDSLWINYINESGLYKWV